MKLDPSYAVYSPKAMVRSSNAERLSIDENRPSTIMTPAFPAKAAVALIDVRQTVAEGLDALFCLAKSQPKPPPSVLLAAVQHVMILTTGCVTSSSESTGTGTPGQHAISDYPRLKHWLSAFTLKVPSPDIRKAVASALFGMCEAEVSMALSTSPTPASDKVTSYIILPCALRALIPRLRDACELLLQAQEAPSPSSEAAAMGAPSLGSLTISISGSEEYFSLLAGLLQLSLRPRWTLDALERLRRGAGEKSVAKPAMNDPDPEIVTPEWELDLNHVSHELAVFLGQCRPAAWLHNSHVADETLSGLLEVALVLIRAHAERRQAFCRSSLVASPTSSCSPSITGFLYHDLLFPHLRDSRVVRRSTRDSLNGSNDNDSANDVDESAEVLGAMYVSARTRSLAYGLLLELCQEDSASLGELVGCIAGKSRVMHEDDLMTVGQGSVAGTKEVEAIVESLLKKHREYTAASNAASIWERYKWDHDPQSFLRDPRQHVGLKNQGATCYMNSLLQQLYHIPDFRRGLLAVDVKESTNLETSVLFQLQALFAFLQTSEKKYSDTLAFCKSLTDYTGEPLRLTEQKDVNEFCGMLFDKLETLDPRVDKLLKSLFGGTLVYQIISRECSHRSERSEPFTMLTAEVKNKSTLEDSLELYVAGEVLGGDNKYMCSQCGTKVEALRRCAIQTLPQILIIHLKRFEFDLETMTKFKVNDRCSFPMVLDMEPFTVEGLALQESRQRGHSLSVGGIGEARRRSNTFQEEEVEAALDHSDGTPHLEQQHDEPGLSDMSSNTLGVSLYVPAKPTTPPDCHMYELRGVVAHVGTADSGHYYSFIRELTSGEGGAGQAKWHEFNDQLVLPFDVQDIPKECFGGTEPIPNVQKVSSSLKDIAFHLARYFHGSYYR